MTINYNWYTTGFWHAAVYATLTVMATVDSKPFNLSQKLGRLNFIFFRFQGQFYIFWDARTKYKNPGLFCIIRNVWHVWL